MTSPEGGLEDGSSDRERKIEMTHSHEQPGGGQSVSKSIEKSPVEQLCFVSSLGGGIVMQTKGNQGKRLGEKKKNRSKNEVAGIE